jgi:hypothetical protein
MIAIKQSAPFFTYYVTAISNFTYGYIKKLMLCVIIQFTNMLAALHTKAIAAMHHCLK